MVWVGEYDPEMDLDQDGVLGPSDRYLWVQVVAGTVPGDTDINGTVDFIDFVQLVNHFHQDGGWGQGDFSGDFVVDFVDFTALSNHFGFVSEGRGVAVVAVPEPSTMDMFGLVGLGLLGRIRYRR